MIPKIIHYCWFGGNPLPKLAKKCIKSWKKYCKDFEIKEWNETNFDVSSAPLYVRQAYEAKKWAFVADYVRLYAMTKFGGIYMDTDVEVVSNLDVFLNNEAFSGFENDEYISTGIMASEKGFPLFEELLSYYDNASFINEDGSLNMTTNVTVITDMCNKYGFVPNGKYQELAGLALYPKDYFCPKDYYGGEMTITENTACIHHFDGSWQSEEWRKSNKRRHRQRKIANIKYSIRYFPNKVMLTVLGEKNYEKIKSRFKR